MVLHKYTVAYFSKNSELVKEWETARAESELRPTNLRGRMATLQMTPWLTPLVKSKGNLLSYILKCERENLRQAGEHGKQVRSFCFALHSFHLCCFCLFQTLMNMMRTGTH